MLERKKNGDVCSSVTEEGRIDEILEGGMGSIIRSRVSILHSSRSKRSTDYYGHKNKNLKHHLDLTQEDLALQGTLLFTALSYSLIIRQICARTRWLLCTSIA